MFVEEKDTVEVILHYKKRGRHFLVYNDSEFESSLLTKEEKETYKTINIKMKLLTWGLYNDLNEASIDIDAEGNRHFNMTRYKELRLSKLIVDWDAMEANGDSLRKKAINHKTLRSLSPEMAEAILSAYDHMMYIDEGEEGK